MPNRPRRLTACSGHATPRDLLRRLQRRDGLNSELFEVATGEQASVDREESEVQGADETADEVDAHDV